jgi:predicted DNA-binding transcriptional regulator AlpA
MEILTVGEVATMLRLSKSQVYELTHPRTRSGDVREHPLPSVRMGTAVRFIRKDVEEWVERLKKLAA